LQGEKGNFARLQIFFAASRPKASFRPVGEVGVSNRDKGSLA